MQILDTSELNIKSVHSVADCNALSFSVGAAVATFGAPLVIELPKQSTNEYAMFCLLFFCIFLSVFQKNVAQCKLLMHGAKLMCN